METTVETMERSATHGSVLTCECCGCVVLDVPADQQDGSGEAPCTMLCRRCAKAYRTNEQRAEGAREGEE